MRDIPQHFPHKKNKTRAYAQVLSTLHFMDPLFGALPYDQFNRHSFHDTRDAVDFFVDE
jgi:hypothetical protein